MRTEADRTYDVLIVGAGPVGMMAGCELLRRGVNVRIIDRAPEPSPFPKALLVWPRSLDLFEDLGVLDELRAASLGINAFSYFSDREHLATFPFPRPLVPLCAPQCETERVLRGALDKLGGTVERGVRLLTLDDLDFSGRIDATDGVTAVLEHPDGSIERTRAPFVIGADGAGSTVRRMMGTGFSGLTYESAFALVDTRIEGDLPPDQALYYQSPAGALVIVALPDGVYRFFCSLAPGEEVSAERMQRIVEQRGPKGIRFTETVWESVFRVHARHAQDFQLGRVFLAGDAAHVHSPAGGQGLNTGMQDAHNLAWKLAAVIHGDAPAELLASYGPERKAVAERVVRDTDIQTRAWMVKSRKGVLVRNAAFRAAARTGVASRFYAPVMAGRRIAYPVRRDTQRPGGRAACRVLGRLPGRARTGAVFPREIALRHGFAGPDADPRAWTLVAVTGASARLREDLREAAAAWPQVSFAAVSAAEVRRATGCAEQGYYLVRPDGHTAAHGHAGDGGRLRAELVAALGEPAQRQRRAARAAGEASEAVAA